MTESADKTEGLRAALHNSAAAQQCEQIPVSPSRLPRCPTWSSELAEVSESQTSANHFFFHIMEALHFLPLMLLKIFPIYSSSALICNIRQSLLLAHALLKSLLRLLNLREEVCQGEKALQHPENKDVLFYLPELTHNICSPRPVPEGHRSERIGHLQLGGQLPAGDVHQGLGEEGGLLPGGHGRAGGMPEEEDFPGTRGPGHPARALPRCVWTRG